MDKYFSFLFLMSRYEKSVRFEVIRISQLQPRRQEHPPPPNGQPPYSKKKIPIFCVVRDFSVSANFGIMILARLEE